MKNVIILITTLFACLGNAQVSLYEQEPNDSPLTGNNFKAPMIVLGNMQDNDQDMFIWQVSDADANYQWHIELDGLPDRLTQLDIFSLDFSDDGQSVTKKKTLLTIKNLGGTSKVIHKDLVFSTGNYYLGLSYAGGNDNSSSLLGDKMLANLGEDFVKENQQLDKLKVSEQISYQLKIIKGKKLYYLNTKDNSKSKPTFLGENSKKGVYFNEKSQWLKFNISELESQNRWIIQGQIETGRKLNLNFYKPNAELAAKTKSNSIGHFILPDLKLEKGDYLIELMSEANATSSIVIKSTGINIDDQEAEPNDIFKDANSFDFDKEISGQMGKANEYDFFKFKINEQLSQNQLEIHLQNNSDSKLEFCLYSSQNKKLQCKTSKGDIALKQLGLVEGSYGLSVARGAVNTQYQIKTTDKGKRKSILEAEPNDRFPLAKAMNAKRVVKGVLDGKDEDFFKFEVMKQDQTWSIQAVGERLTYLSLYNSAGHQVQEVRHIKGVKRIKLSHLNLLPGTHVIRVYGENSKYLLRAFPTGATDNSFETEPNDKAQQAMRLEMNRSKKGLLQNLADKDLYRFHLNNQGGIKLKIKVPDDARIKYHLYWEGMQIGRRFSELGEDLEYIGQLQAGDYQLQLMADKQSSDDVYHIELSPYDVSGCFIDCEPNDNPYQANLIKPTSLLKGMTGTVEDYDWFKLPAFDKDTVVTFQNNQSNNDQLIRAYINYDKSLKASYDVKLFQTSFLIPAQQESYFRLGHGRLRSIYDYKILIDKKELKAPVIPPSQLTMSFKQNGNVVQAFSDYAQNVTNEIIIENSGSKTESFEIQSQTTDFSWKVLYDDKKYQLAAGKELNIPFDINVPTNIANDQKVAVTLKLHNEYGLITQNKLFVESKAHVKNLKPTLYQPIAKEILGGINVAATAMGSERTKEDLAFNVSAIGTGFEKLFDGFSAVGLGMQYRGGRKSEQDFITIKLAGNELIDVQGIILNPLSQAKPNLYLKDFELHLSEDGVEFKKVLQGQLQPVNVEQSFVLPEIVKAKFARLYLLNSYENRDKSQISLGEWKVIASPNQTINSEGFNLADPKLGGHVAWADPVISNRWDISLLTEEHENVKASSKVEKDWQWVVGFHNQRAAKVTHIQWQHSSVDSSKMRNVSQFNKLKVLVSTQSNVGPWKLVAEKQLSSNTGVEKIVFQKPTWVRFVKFSVDGVKKRTLVYLPETIRIFEQTTNENYQSILGEWGELQEKAIYEKLNPAKIATTFDDKNNNIQSAAIDLSQIKTASGQVQLEHLDQPDWYKYTTTTGENTLKIKLSGKQTVETVLKVFDQQSQQLAYSKLKNNINDANYQFPVEANKSYFIKIEEPPRSVIFAWDTSGSTQKYEPMIYKAISSYSNEVITGRDTVNFLPFGGQLLMKDWYGTPYYLKTILNNYARKHDSSAAETSLLTASKALENRQGSKAIIVITDAITGRNAKMWDSFKKVHPRIFSIGIIGNGFGGDPNRQIDLMQSWSRVNNGDFQKVVTANEVERAFERVAIKLRQPADYTIQLSSEFIKVPGPGQLVIKQDQNQQSSAVELILDASGSMLKRLDGQRRINIAKEVLVKAVTEIIPEHTPLALRVFGDKQANSCRTDLAIKLGPLNRQKAKSIINKIYAKNLAKTPIADSLAKVASDLKSHKGKKIVILVTDGEETCDGNPEEVIAKMIDDGIDIRLNIVGFAIDDMALKDQFNQWSTQGGGQYFDSDNPESLKESVSQALKIPFSVYTQTGELLKQGVVNGKPLELASGYYTIKVFANEVKTFENYKIEGEKTQMIELMEK